MATTTPIVLSDLVSFPRTLNRVWVRDAVLVLSAALFTALCAQVTIHLGFTPVPLTGQTFAVLSVGGILGARRAMASQVAYWMLGAIGLPFYSAATGGWTRATGSTFGYFVGFVLAAGVVGWFADRRDDRNYISSLSAMFLASGIIYACGSLWLAHALNIPVASGETNAISLGVSPFLAGDVVKIALAAAIAPLGWASYYAKPR
jgi:biotin transport system substrate-specific component